MPKKEATASQSLGVEQHPMIDVPFPLSSGTLAWLRYPKHGLTAKDPERFAEFLRALVIDTQEAASSRLPKGKP
jgi:hypothetical protein